jgi:hypothetical protein
MIISYPELLVAYRAYRNPKDKIAREVRTGTYFPIAKGLYETDPQTDGRLLSGSIVSPSYLSFEYVLSQNGLIPERVVAYTCATTQQKHNRRYQNHFGIFLYSDVPLSAWRFGVQSVQEKGYSYLVATPEKALCDLLSKKPAVLSVKGLKELLFEDLRIDEDSFDKLDRGILIALCPLYRKKNLNFLKKMIEKEAA